MLERDWLFYVHITEHVLFLLYKFIKIYSINSSFDLVINFARLYSELFASTYLYEICFL